MKTLSNLTLVALLPLSACALDAGAATAALSAELLREVAHAATTPLRTTAAPAAHRPAADRAPQEGERRIAVGVGFTDSPDTLLIGGQADFYQSDRVAIGPSLQLGFDDDVTLFAPSFHGKFVFPTEPMSDGVLLLPFVQGGAGFVYIERDRGGSDEWGLLLQAGGGLEVRLDDQYALSSTLLVNLVPDEANDESAYVSWQIVQFSFVF